MQVNKKHWLLYVKNLQVGSAYLCNKTNWVVAVGYGILPALGNGSRLFHLGIA